MDLPEDLVKEIHADRLRCRARLLEDQNPTFAAARRYLQRGWRPVPVHPHEKRPLIAWAAYQDRAPTLAEIMAWWQEHREARVGLVTGRGSGLVVVDIDVQHGGTLEGVDVPEGAYRVRTPSGGLHLYMAHPGGQVASRAGVRPGVDVRGDGGFVVAPPSPGYVAETRLACDLPVSPAWVQERPQASQSERKRASWFAEVFAETTPEGARNDTATRLAGYLFHRGLSPAETQVILTDWASRRDA